MRGFVLLTQLNGEPIWVNLQYCTHMRAPAKFPGQSGHAVATRLTMHEDDPLWVREPPDEILQMVRLTDRQMAWLTDRTTGR